MTPQQKKLFSGVLFSALGLSSIAAHATNGYFAHGYGARSKAMAGTGVAFSQDAVAGALNPAGLVYVGTRLDVEVELFSPLRQYTVQGGPTPTSTFPLATGTVESQSDVFVVPTVGWSYKIDNKQSVGVTLYGNGGMNTDYPVTPSPSPNCPQGGTFCAGFTGVDLSQAFLVGSYAHSFADGRYALGISPIFAMQTFKANGLANFAGYSSDSQHLSNAGRDYSYGAGFRVGGQAELIPGVRLGAAYKSRIYMTKLTSYSGLFADQGGFDIPDSFNVGLSWAINKALTTAFDVEQIRYSQVNSVGDPLLPLTAGSLGTHTGPGFGWRDMTIYKLGAQWQQSEKLILRGGVSYGQQPVDSSQVLFNILAPGVQEWHLTTGFSYAFTNQDELSFAFMYSPPKTVNGPNPLSSGQTIELQMYQFSGQFAWSRRF
ncbi:MAG: outer membrane protein transport protein [Methylococcaceae bacterium]